MQNSAAAQREFCIVLVRIERQENKARKHLSTYDQECSHSSGTAAESMVLLKNVGNTLPLLGSSEEPVPVALFGVGQIYTVKGGTGSGNVNNLKTISLLEGMENCLSCSWTAFLREISHLVPVP